MVNDNIFPMIGCQLQKYNMRPFNLLFCFLFHPKIPSASSSDVRMRGSVSICCDTHVAHAYGRTQFAIIRSFPCLCIFTIYIIICLIIRMCFALLYTYHLSIFIIILFYISNILSIFTITETLLLVFTIYNFLKYLL